MKCAVVSEAKGPGHGRRVVVSGMWPPRCIHMPLTSALLVLLRLLSLTTTHHSLLSPRLHFPKSIFEGSFGCGYLKERRASGLVFCENTASVYRALFVSSQRFLLLFSWRLQSVDWAFSALRWGGMAWHAFLLVA